MSSSYYVNALFSKYTAGASLFQNAEPTSCSFASNSQRSGYGPGAGAFASSVPGLYNVNSAIYQSPFSSGYSLGSDAYNLHCSSFDQNIPVLCNELTKPSCEKAEESNLHNQAEPNFRIYPWMRSSGRGERRGLGAVAARQKRVARITVSTAFMVLIIAEAPLRRKPVALYVNEYHKTFYCPINGF